MSSPVGGCSDNSAILGVCGIVLLNALSKVFFSFPPFSLTPFPAFLYPLPSSEYYSGSISQRFASSFSASLFHLRLLSSSFHAFLKSRTTFSSRFSLKLTFSFVSLLLLLHGFNVLFMLHGSVANQLQLRTHFRPSLFPVRQQCSVAAVGALVSHLQFAVHFCLHFLARLAVPLLCFVAPVGTVAALDCMPISRCRSPACSSASHLSLSTRLLSKPDKTAAILSLACTACH